MPTVAARFTECHPRPWNGRYARIPGDCAVFHLHLVAGRLWPVMLWDTEDGRATCRAVSCEVAAHLADAVARAKRYAGGSGGGCFLINEFGQVLVPASDGDGRRFLAGTIEGRLLFENPFLPEEPIDLGDNSSLQPGDPWKLPYLGVPHNLHRNGHIYFYREDEFGGSPVHPLRQDTTLIRRLRDLRPRGPVRFLVNPFGLVLTKCPPDEGWCSEEHWQPVYVGSISLSLWFAKE